MSVQYTVKIYISSAMVEAKHTFIFTEKWNPSETFNRHFCQRRQQKANEKKQKKS